MILPSTYTTRRKKTEGIPVGQFIVTVKKTDDPKKSYNTKSV